ncbi:MAG: helix-turn-helix domain-containing protein [Stigonema ocellatum SAG 48.90 = DSM 106950]|nr:helix-turn-helix domain-containing protein [Stigonema ocellatum SAG 48.90 = DSM 106950]
MGQAGKALRQVLEAHGISQSSLAAALGVERPIVFRWFHEHTDPTAETVAGIVRVLQQINSTAAKEFIKLYLCDVIQDREIDLMTDIPHELPQSNTVNISVLSGLFTNTTNSYKYLFFISLLDILKRRQFDILSPISFREIIIEMLANAWYPHTYFKLSFGLQDKITEKLDSLKLEIGEPILKFTDTDKKILRKTIGNQHIDDIVTFIVRYVPFRLIRPFFEQELKGLKDSEVEKKILSLSQEQFEVKKPLYYFDANLYKDCKSIILHSEWVSYIEANYSIIRAWASWEWLKYMQKRNLNIPAVANKLFPPHERGGLNPQKSYWKLIFKETDIQCIYSKQALYPESFSLDHYLPWSFVAHDQPWNLIPTFAEVNSSKSNHIPDNDYFDEFVKMQHLGLLISHKIMGKQQWINYVEPYINDLRLIEENNLLNLEILKSAYESTLTPLISIALGQGFTRWSYR